MFCGGGPVTEEHVIADWVRQLLGEQPRSNHTLYAPGKSIRQFSRLPHTLTAKVVCRRCNNGWMSDLEAGVQPHLSRAIQGESDWLLDAKAHETIAAWAAKTAMILEWVGDTRPPLIPAAHFRELFENKTRPPEGTSVWIGAYGGTSFESLCARNAISVVANTREHESIDENDPHFYLSTVSIRHLVVHLCGRLPAARTRSDTGVSGPTFRRIHPSTGSFAWPPGPPLADEGLVAFVNL